MKLSKKKNKVRFEQYLFKKQKDNNITELNKIFRNFIA